MNPLASAYRTWQGLEQWTFTLAGRRLQPFSLLMAVVKKARADDVAGLAAEMAYHFILALFPFLLFLVALTGFVSSEVGVPNAFQQIMAFLETRLPPETAHLLSILVSEVVQGRSPGLLTLSLLATLWAASNGVSAVMKALNRVYAVPEARPFWKAKLVALGLTLLFSTSIILSVLLMIFGADLSRRVAGLLGLGATLEFLWTLAVWPAMVGALIIALAVLYWAAPAQRRPFRWITPGSVIAVVAWLLATYGFTVYVENFGNFNATYGAIGGAIILLVWLYITSMIILIGGELNYALAEGFRPCGTKATRGRGEAVRTDGEDKQDSGGCSV